MDTLSVQEAAQRLDCTQKTIYRYLESGKLHSEKIGMMHFIPAQEVEALRVSRHNVQSEDMHLKQRIDTLYELLEAQDFRIKQLEEQVHAQLDQDALTAYLKSHQEAQQTPVPITPPDVTPIHTHASTTPRSTRHSTDRDQPEGAITLQAFADQLGISRTSLREYVTKHGLPHTSIPNLSRPGEHKRYFSQSDQEAYRKHRGLV